MLSRFRSSRLWIAPLIGIAVAAVLAAIALLVDRHFDWTEPPVPLFSGTRGASGTLLSMIAMAVTTLLALVFTILAVVIQLGSGQYSPRVLRTLYQDFPSHFTIGVFVATITYALLILLAAGPPGHQPHAVAVTLACGMAALSIVTFAIYANHILHAVRISSIINRIAEDTRRQINREFPDPFRRGSSAEPDLTGPCEVIRSRRWGVIAAVDDEALIEAAARHDLVIVLAAGIGGQVHENAALMHVHNLRGNEGVDLRHHVSLANDREMVFDVAWGFRILADIAIRAVSPGINDPTTATQALDRLHALLRVLAGQSLSVGRHVDNQGSTRLVVPAPTWEYFVSLATDEISQDGASKLQVAWRLREMLEDIKAVAPRERRMPLASRMELLDSRTSELLRPSTNRRSLPVRA